MAIESSVRRLRLHSVLIEDRKQISPSAAERKKFTAAPAGPTTISLTHVRFWIFRLSFHQLLLKKQAFFCRICPPPIQSS